MSAPIRARLGQPIEAQLAQIGGNLSAALRACVLLGFASAGVDMTPFRKEIQRTLLEDLSPEIGQALEAIGERRTAVGQVSYSRPTEVDQPLLEAIEEPGASNQQLEEPDDDPFASAGVEV